MSKIYYSAMLGCLALMLPILVLSLLESNPISGLIANLTLAAIALRLGNKAENAYNNKKLCKVR